MKLKHRITGTILAIVFATTSILPAATIPQLKQAPVVKTPVAPKVVAAPKVPVVPKIVSAPKVPAVKIPTVKIPTAPKVPAIVKVPVVKTPVMPKIPLIKEAPKLPKTPPAVVVKVPQAPKAAQTTATAQKPVKVPAATAATKSPVIAQGLAGNVGVNVVREAVRGARRDNEDRGPKGGPASKLVPSHDKGANASRGDELAGKVRGKGTTDDASKQSRIDALRGGGKSNEELAAAAAISQINTGKTDRPGFDQGFASSPDLSGFKGGFGNPMSGITNGGSIGGPLGAAADKAGNGSPGGLAGMGTSLISDGGAASSGGQATFDDDEGVKGRGSNKGLLDLLKDRFGVNEKQANEAVKATVGIGNNRNGSEFLNDPNGDPAPAAKPAGDPPAADADKTTTKSSSDGRNTVVTDPDGTKHVYVNGSKVGTVAPDGTATPTPAKSVGQPDPENEGVVKVDVISQSSSLLQQIGQSRSGKKGSQGGNGDMTPVDEASSSVANGVVITQQGTIAAKNNLLGNPGQRGGLREGGGTANAPVRSNGSGVITPTNDQNMSSSGGRQEDPGSFFGNGVSPDTSRLNNSPTNNNEDESSGSSTSSSSSKDTKKKK